ncbi:MAG: formimidoylglutamate deiminase [Deltaproteobacteria bacterium]|nr:MAG: formimidoylglutamate deiminase [Deltaproteobacteria bacterium]
MEVLRPDWVFTAAGLRRDVAVCVDGDRIVGLLPAERQPDDVVRLPGRVLVPSLVNAHSHAFQRAFRGHVQWSEGDDDFWTWRKAMYGVANSLDPDGIEAISRLAFLEMAESGIGHVGEFHYLHHRPGGGRYDDPDELARRVICAALDVGIRITLLRVVYGRHSPGRPLERDQARFGDRDPVEALAAAERLAAHPDPRVTAGIAPHSVRAVPPEWLGELAQWDGVVHAHVAEQPAEVAGCFAEHGCSPLQAFGNAGLVGPGFSAVHLTHPSQGDLPYLRAAEGNVVACPTTEMDLGDGFLPVEARDLHVALGSDSHAAIDLLWEARTLELHARAMAGRRNVLSPPGERHGLAERLLRAATIDGSRSLGVDSEGIKVGAPADLCAIDLRRVAAVGMPALEAVVFAANPDWVSDVWVAGKRIVEEGRHPGRERIIREARAHLLR